MSTDTTVATRQVSVKSLVESPAYSNRLKSLMGEKSQSFVSSLIQISQDWKLSKCDPHSVIAAGMTAGALDLPINPNLGFAYVIPYGDKASFQIGYKGLVQLAMRSGQYKRLNVAIVYDGELLKYDRVKADVVLDSAMKKSDKVIGYVAYFELVNGAEHAEYWEIETVQTHATRFSQAYKAKKKDSPWFTDFDRMAMKTVLKSLISHWGPLSIQMQKAVIHDQSIQNDPDGDITYPDNQNPDGDGVKSPKVIDIEGSKTELFPGSKLDEIRTKLTADITESDVVTFIHTAKLTDDSLKNLEEIHMQAPSALEAVLKTWPDVSKKIKKAKETK